MHNPIGCRNVDVPVTAIHSYVLASSHFPYPS